EDDRPVFAVYESESGNRSFTIEVTFGEDEIVADVLETEGIEARFDYPEDGRVVDDVVAAIAQDGWPEEERKETTYVFDPNTVTLVQIDVSFMGKQNAIVLGEEREAWVVQVEDPRAPTSIYFDEEGDLLEASGPLGISMRPETRDQALTMPEGLDLRIDLADVGSIPLSGERSRLRGADSAVYRFTNANLDHLPSDAHQTVTEVEGGWRVEVHPNRPDDNQGLSEKPPGTWLEPEPRVPVDSPTFQAKADDLARGESRLEQAEAIRQYVHARIRTNAGIGVLRDAGEIMETGEGVCRDHAILMATLLRAADVPTRLISGLVLQNGRFYYHAWVEIYTGEEWIGIDSTRNQRFVGPTHVKIAEGTVAEALSGFLLDGAEATLVAAEGD
ncbi:MAG: transglutaminase-like domain-containing protein, partial [Fimbriimonadaceae bacterium]